MKYFMIALLSLSPILSRAQISVDDNFPGGNVIVEKIANDTVFSAPI